MKIPNVTHLNNRKRNIDSVKVFQFQELFEELVDGVCIVDEVGGIEYVNPAYEVMFGVSGFAITGKSVYRATNDDVLLTSFKNKKQVQGYLSLSLNPNKISANASPFYIDNEFRGVIGIYHLDRIKPISSQEKPIVAFHRIKPDTVTLHKSFDDVIIGDSRCLREELKLAERAAKTFSTVLIRGESGTGKELVAKAIHEAGYTKNKPFVKINCTSIPATLLEAELFGYEQGAFTGAIKKKIGKFEQANDGTIFLDEIGDMPIDMQVKILRILQEKEFERIGGNETIRSNVRIIAATHRNLEDLIKKGLFREDLYYRLNVIPIQLPSLRERKEDIITLCNHFINIMHEKTKLPFKILTDDVKDVLYHYDWPGNTRELENLIERLVVLTDGDTITINDVPSHISNNYKVNMIDSTNTSLINMTQDGQIATLEDYEKEIIQRALKRHRSFNAAAKVLGITHKTVAFKARKYGIRFNFGKK